jgi:hypothetical protein
MTQEEFILKAIEKLPTPGKKGIHTVFSGFNNAFREYFKGADPIKATQAAAAKGLITTFPVKKGAMLYKAGEGPKNNGADVLAKILER